MAELRVEALRGLNALAPEDLRRQFIATHLGAAEDLLRCRQAAFSRCSLPTCTDRCLIPTCTGRCRLYDV
jgi:hypothetical protein